MPAPTACAPTIPPPRSCLADDCGLPVPADAPLALCFEHFALAAEWAADRDGTPDVLPSPCRLCGSRVGVRYPSGWVCAVCEWRLGEVVDGELPPPRVDVVYYLRWQDRVKIGTTTNPKQRFAAIRHDELLTLERGGRTLERHRHEQFAADRFTTGSEWFRLSPAILAHLAAVSAGGEDPWDVLARWLSEALALRG